MKRFLSAVLALALSAQPALGAGGNRVIVLPLKGGVSAGRIALPNVSIPALSAPELPALPDLSAPGLRVPAIAPVQVLPALRAQEAAARKIARLSGVVGADLPTLGGGTAESAGGKAAAHADQLAGLTPAAVAPNAVEVPSSSQAAAPKAPSRLSLSGIRRALSFRRSGPPKPPRKPDAPGVRGILWAVPVFKLGAEAASLAIPIIALQTGGALGVAGLVIVYQAAQAVGGWIAAGLTSRWRGSAVAAGGMAVQAAAIAVVLGAAALGGFSYWMLFPTYAVVGATLGLIDTARKSIPALLIGQDADALREFNARLHQRYQVAGVAGAFAIAGLMAVIGPLWTLAIQPLAFGLAAYLMARVKHAKQESEPSKGGLLAGLKAWAVGMKDGAVTLVKEPRYRWIVFAMILPLVVHRVFEDLFMPVYAKGVLGAAALTGVLRAVSNLGEYGGATALLKWSNKGAASWVKFGGLGMAAAWALSLAAGLSLAWSLVLLVPAIFLFSATWASSHLSLESDLQERLPLKDQPHAMAVLNGLNIAVTAAATYALGRLFQSAGPSGGFLVIELGLSILGVALLYAAARLKKTDRR